MTDQEAKEFMSKPLPERFHQFMLMEICDESGYQDLMSRNEYNYLPVLQDIKNKLPVEFFAYFHDLLCEEEYDKYEKEFIKAFK